MKNFATHNVFMQDFLSIIKNIINLWLIHNLFYKKSEIVFALMYKVGSHNCNVLESQKSFAFPTVPLKGRRQGLCKVLFQKLFRTEFKILLFFGFLHTFWNKVEKRTLKINTSFSAVRKTFKNFDLEIKKCKKGPLSHFWNISNRKLTSSKSFFGGGFLSGYPFPRKNGIGIWNPEKSHPEANWCIFHYENFDSFIAEASKINYYAFLCERLIWGLKRKIFFRAHQSIF